MGHLATTYIYILPKNMQSVTKQFYEHGYQYSLKVVRLNFTCLARTGKA